MPEYRITGRIHFFFADNMLFLIDYYSKFTTYLQHIVVYVKENIRKSLLYDFPVPGNTVKV